MEKIPKIKPFRHFIMTLGTIPTSYLESMSYAEMLAWFCKFLKDTVIPAINNNAEAIEELQNYFDTLNVQEEINNKLDEMAESGQLEEIISLYLDSQSIIGFNTIADLKGAENLINGSFAKTYGKLTYNDKEGAFYKVRLKTPSDVIDDDLIVGLTLFSDLVAEKIGNKEIEDINDTIGDLTDLNTTSTTSIVDAINSTITDSIVIFGDSWSDEQVSGVLWPSNVANYLHLTKYNYAVNGATITDSNNSMSTQVETFLESDVNKENVKYIVICGGINDYRHEVTSSDVRDSINSYYSDLKTACPQAKIIYVNNFEYPFTETQSSYWIQLNNYLSSYGIVSLNMDGMIGKPLFNSANWFHLTESGQNWFAKNISSCLSGGQIQGYRENNIVEDTYVKVIYSCERIDNIAYISITVLPKQEFTSHTVSYSGTALPYAPLPIVGMIGAGYVNVVCQVNSDSIVISSSDDLNTIRVYQFNYTIPLRKD